MNLMNGTLRSPEKAEEAAAILNATDDWTYVVKPMGKYASVEVYDEDGVLLGTI